MKNTSQDIRLKHIDIGLPVHRSFGFAIPAERVNRFSPGFFRNNSLLALHACM
jgi:hypothetical protein